MRPFWKRSSPRPEPSSKGETQDFLADSGPPIGREQDKRSILDLLELDGNHVVTIHGIGGSGKTTLAKLVYDEVHEFKPKIQIYVSDSFEFGKVIKKILDRLGENVTGRENVGELEEKLREGLRGKSFLVVLDDLRSEHAGTWRELANLLMASSNQGKIIVTTREQSLVDMIYMSTEMATVSSHPLNVLSNRHLLLLLERYAVRRGEEIPNDLRRIGEEIVARCEGLPLAVKILAVLLSEKREAAHWESIRDRNQDMFEVLLKLCRDLPVYCKDRFFYFSPLLQHKYIKYKDLFDLWMTDGLFESLDQEMSVTVVEKELKSIIEERQWKILRDLICHPTIISRLTENHWPVINVSNEKVEEHVVHLSIGCPNFGGDRNPVLRTLFLWVSKSDSVSKLFSKKRVSKFKLLRMLVLKKSLLEVLSCIDYMSRLKCLNLSGCSRLKKLPSFIFKMQSLEILKLEGCNNLESLPEDIKKLSGLKVLSITARKIDSLSAIESLTSLQSLLFRACRDSLPIGKYLTSLTALRSLTIYDCLRVDFTEKDDAAAASQTLLELKLDQLKNLEALPLGTMRLQLLDIQHCEKLNKLSDCLPEMPLESIVIEDCRQLLSLPKEMPRLQSLRTLKIRLCPGLKRYIENIEDEDERNYFQDKLV